MERNPLNNVNRKRRSVDAIEKDDIKSLAEWKSGFISTPKRRSLSNRDSPTAFSTSTATPAPLATLDEDDWENKEEFSQHESDCDLRVDQATLTFTPDKSMDTPKRGFPFLRRSTSVPLTPNTFIDKRNVKEECLADFDCVFDKIKSASDRYLSEKATTSSPVTLYEEKVLRRPHAFVNKSVFVKFTCSVCTDSTHFALNAKKCIDCKLMFHDGCSSQAAIPCIPWTESPKPKDGRLRLGEYSADVKPKLPSILRHCVRYLNSDTMVKGLYTKNSSDKVASSLLQCLIEQKAPPNFSTYGPNDVSLCIMKFLQSIREPLIPMSSNEEFYEACLLNDNAKLKHAIDDLPTVHKNTLAYLFLHWQLLAKFSKINGLTPDALADALIPVIMRGSKDGYPQKYNQVFIHLLSLPALYWQQVIEDDCKPLLNTPIRSSSKKAKIALSRSITVNKLQEARRFY